MTFSTWSQTAASNTSVGGISTDGTVTLVKQIDDMFRGMMAELAVARDDGTILSVPPRLAGQRNRIVNPAMQTSQQNGNASGTTNNYYAADQWVTVYTTSAGTITSQRVQSITPNDSQDRYRVTITVADASLAAGEFLIINQKIEGTRVPDFRYGSASARQSILRFGFKGPAGTFAVAIRNSATNRSYVALFTITGGQANTDTEQTFVIPGDTAGTWLTDTGIGLDVSITLASGSTFQGATGWQGGNILGTSGVTNGMATGGSVFELFDVSLYLDKNSTGVAPRWEAPNDASNVTECQRYYQVINLTGAGGVSGAFTINHPTMLPVPMRAVPTYAATGSTNTNTTGATIVPLGNFGATLSATSIGAGGYICGSTGSLAARL